MRHPATYEGQPVPRMLGRLRHRGAFRRYQSALIAASRERTTRMLAASGLGLEAWHAEFAGAWAAFCAVADRDWRTF